jgi:hypothetical protein
MKAEVNEEVRMNAIGSAPWFARAFVIGAVLGSAVIGAFVGPAEAGPQFVVALDGYDAVAYQKAGKAIEGRNDHAYFWNGATWLFASDAARDAFAAEPERYAPQYDGYCAYAAANGYRAPGSPQAWKVVDGRLYVNFSEHALRLWLKDIAGHIAAADANWPKLNAN